MTPLILFAGNKMDSFIVLAGAPYDFTNGGFDSQYVDSGIYLNPGWSVKPKGLYDASMAPYAMPSGHTLWFHMETQNRGFDTGYNDGLYFYDSTNFPWFKVQSRSAAALQVFANTGTGASPVWTLLGAAWGTPQHYALDIQLVVGDTGNHSAVVYIDGTQTTSGGTWSQPLFTNVANFTLQSFDTGASWQFSQILVTQDQPTIGAKVAAVRATSAGDYQEWTGGYTNINEPDGNDSTFDQATDSNLSQTYNVGNITVPNNYNIATVFHWIRANNSGVPDPSNIKSILRKNSTDYISGDLDGVGLGFAATGQRYDIDPTTGVRWTQNGFNTQVQFGYKSDV